MQRRLQRIAEAAGPSGLRSAIDKTSGVNYSLSHELMVYDMRPEVLQGAGPAYALNVRRPVRTGELNSAAP